MEADFKVNLPIIDVEEEKPESPLIRMKSNANLFKERDVWLLDCVAYSFTEKAGSSEILRRRERDKKDSRKSRKRSMPFDRDIVFTIF